MTSKTITWISDVGDAPDKFGNHYVNVSFSDDTAGYIGSKRERAQEHAWRLTLLKDTPGEFRLEEKGATKAGKPKFKILAYPGFEPQPQSSSDGSGNGRSSWSLEDSIALDRVKERATNARVALMQVAESHRTQGGSVTRLVEHLPDMDALFGWLESKSVGAPGSAVVADGTMAGSWDAPQPEGGSGPSPRTREFRTSHEPAASTQESGETPWGESSPAVEGEPSESLPLGEGGEGSGSPSRFAKRPQDCSHPKEAWQPSPMKGWRICSTCGHAEKGAA